MSTEATGLYNVVWTAWYLAFMQVHRRYVGSFIGVLWTLVNPIMRVLVLYMVFTYIFPCNIPHFLGYLFFGILAWDFLAASCTTASQSLYNRSTVLSCCTVPRYMFVLVDVFSEFINFLLALSAAMVFVYTTDLPFPLSAFLLPVVLLPLFFFSVGMGLLLANVGVRFRDVTHMLGVLFQFAFWFTPLAYKTELAPRALRLIARYNPLWWVIRPVREALYDGTFPDLPVFLLAAGAAALALGLGLLAERRLGPYSVLYQ